MLRTDIERALDDLISNEAGMTFQGLAVILAKQRWPELVAAERKKDLGADAVGGGKPSRNPRFHPGTDALLQVGDDLVADARVNILPLVVHGPVLRWGPVNSEPPQTDRSGATRGPVTKGKRPTREERRMERAAPLTGSRSRPGVEGTRFGTGLGRTKLARGGQRISGEVERGVGLRHGDCCVRKGCAKQLQALLKAGLSGYLPMTLSVSAICVHMVSASRCAAESLSNVP